MRILSALGSVALLSLAACGTASSGGSAGSGASSSPAPSPSSATSSPAATGAVLAVRTTSLGPVLVDSRGRTVYLLTADKSSSAPAGHSTCTTSCLSYWPAVAAPASMPATLPGVTARVSSAASMGGGKLLTAAGWPLYTFVKDQKPGDVTGQGVQAFGGTWYAVTPSGQPVTAKASPSSSGTGRYGY